MIENILWGISFITVYLAFVWINFLYLDLLQDEKNVSRWYSIDVAIPAYNEESTIAACISSVLKLNYPKDKLRIIVVNDGSIDNTKNIVEKLCKKHDNILLVNKKNEGSKAAAMNAALKHAESELFACVDADSFVTKDALRNMLHHFEDDSVGAVISAIKVYKPKNILEKIQRIEYILAVLSRKLRASINTLAMTPGVLSVYKTQVIKKVGGFDTENITEDFEIAMRLKYNHYNVKIEPNAFTYTKAPDTFKALFNQRIRWYRGFFVNHLKYKDMFFNKEYGLMAFFQLPLNVLGIPLMLVTLGLISYGLITRFAEFMVRGLFIQGYIASLFQLPSLKDLVLTQNIKVFFPIWIGGIAGAYMFIVAHKQVKEKIFFPLSIWVYFMCLPYLVGFYWVSALTKEIVKAKRKW